MAIKVICNRCGKEIDANTYSFSYLQQLGYGSVHDGDELSVDLCPECTDELITYLTEECTIPPLAEGDAV